LSGCYIKERRQYNDFVHVNMDMPQWNLRERRDDD
jgi:hypothetical protein